MPTTTKKLTAPLCIITAALALSACNMHPASPTHLPPGEYERTEQHTNSAGTEVTKTTNTSVYYDEHGNKRAVQDTETTRDPEGLFNKSSTNTRKTYD